jgi:hypothetical protein
VTRPIEVRRLKAADAERMHRIVAMPPPPEWRGEQVPRLPLFVRAPADPAVEFDLATSVGEKN